MDTVSAEMALLEEESLRLLRMINTIAQYQTAEGDRRTHNERPIRDRRLTGERRSIDERRFQHGMQATGDERRATERRAERDRRSGAERRLPLRQRQKALHGAMVAVMQRHGQLAVRRHGLAVSRGP